MDMKAKKFRLDGSLKSSKDMKSDAKKITDAIHSLGDGVNAVRVDPLENTVTVDYTEGKVSPDEIQRKLDNWKSNN